MDKENEGLEELKTGDKVIQTYIAGNKFDVKQITCSVVDGKAIFEGDILIGNVEEVENRSPEDAESKQGTTEENNVRGIGVTGQRYRWPNRKVPYSIDPSLPKKERVTDAIKHWEEKTNGAFKFVQRGTDPSVNHGNYISFENQGGCFSAVGMQGTGKQVISLGPDCTTGNAIHEMGHALGLWHEQSREDRGKFVKIIWGNIERNKWHNFTQHVTDGDDLGDYDYGSIMHYPRKAFSMNGQDTVVPNSSAAVEIGQRRGLSQGDIQAINQMYGL
jgi:hypothetical protein